MTEIRVQLGANVTQGLGAGARPEVGRAAADESIEQYDKALENCEKGLKFAPDDSDLLSMKALTYLNMEKYDLAEKHFLELFLPLLFHNI